MLNQDQIKEVFKTANPEFAARQIIVTFAANARATVIGHIIRVIDCEYNTIYHEKHLYAKV